MSEQTELSIRPARATDFEAIWNIIRQVIAQGDTYAFPPHMSREEGRAVWMNPAINTYVAERDGAVVGTYILKANQAGPGGHVANAAYMVDPNARRQGVGEAMAHHSLEEARRAGFLALQFNLVVSTNTAAVKLWQKLGFAIVGTLPGAFRHPAQGLVDAYVMYRFLDGEP